MKVAAPSIHIDATLLPPSQYFTSPGNFPTY